MLSEQCSFFRRIRHSWRRLRDWDVLVAIPIDQDADGSAFNGQRQTARQAYYRGMKQAAHWRCPCARREQERANATE